MAVLQQALQKLQKEIGEKAGDVYVSHVGAYLIKYVRQHPEHAVFIVADGKTITGSLVAMKEEARKRQTNGIGVLSDEEGYAVVLKYFGVPVRQPASTAIQPELTTSSIDDLL
jgi:hypothetical protein